MKPPVTCEVRTNNVGKVAVKFTGACGKTHETEVQTPEGANGYSVLHAFRDGLAGLVSSALREEGIDDVPPPKDETEPADEPDADAAKPKKSKHPPAK